MVEHILATRKHPQGLSQLPGDPPAGRSVPDWRPPRRAIALGAYAYKNIESILKNHKPLPPSTPDLPPIDHDNLRGPDYYH